MSQQPPATASDEQHCQAGLAVPGIMTVGDGSCGAQAFNMHLSRLVQYLRGELAAEVLQQFWSEWDDVGGGPCASLRAAAATAFQGDSACWHDVRVPAEDLQEICWEKLHTGHWMDVQLAWRDAYTLYSLLAVVAKLAEAASPPETPAAQTPAAAQTAAGQDSGGQQQQQQQQQDHHLAASCAEQQGVQQVPQHAGTATAGQQHETTSSAAAAAVTALLADAMKQLDLAAMMGGLRFRPLLDRVINLVDQALQQQSSSSLGLRAAGASAAGAGAAGAGAAGAGAAGVSAAGAGAAGAGTAGVSAAGAGAAAGIGATGAAARECAEGSVSDREQQAGRDNAADADMAAAKRRRLDVPQGPAADGAERDACGGSQQGGAGAAGSISELLPPRSLMPASAVVPVEHAPSLEHFLTRYLLAEGGPVPVVVRGAMTHWPALTKWQDLGYLSKVAGRRTVPVELGQHYLQEGWGTQLMTLDTFMATHMAGHEAGGTAGDGSSEERLAAAAASSENNKQQQQPLGYLAQHQLFEQVPALAADVATPDYCMLGEQGVSSVNAWFGPKGTVTPLHQDPEHNFLAQVVGRKYVRLYDPKHTAQLYPHQEGMHTNTSQVDVGAVDGAKFPGFSDVPYTDVVLEPGDMLYMPPKWWHYVKSLSRSFSVSFWWS